MRIIFYANIVGVKDLKGLMESDKSENFALINDKTKAYCVIIKDQSNGLVYSITLEEEAEEEGLFHIFYKGSYENFLKQKDIPEFCYIKVAFMTSDIIHYDISEHSIIELPNLSVSSFIFLWDLFIKMHKKINSDLMESDINTVLYDENYNFFKDIEDHQAIEGKMMILNDRDNEMSDKKRI